MEPPEDAFRRGSLFRPEIKFILYIDKFLVDVLTNAIMALIIYQAITHLYFIFLKTISNLTGIVVRCVTIGNHTFTQLTRGYYHLLSSCPAFKVIIIKINCIQDNL